MRKDIAKLICAAICCTPMVGLAQNGEHITRADHLYKEGKELFRAQNYAAAAPVLEAFLQQPATVGLTEEAEYMLVCSAYELKDKKRVERLRRFLRRYPDTPYATRVYALLASCYFYEENYSEALALLAASDLSLLPDDERDEHTYQLAVCQLKTGQLAQAAVWLETLLATGGPHERDCTYYLAYIRYTQQRYDEALKGFLPLQDDGKYKTLVPYYIAESYARLQRYDMAQTVAENFLSAVGQDRHAPEMYRILGEALYRQEQYDRAAQALAHYVASADGTPRRDALYMWGISCFRTGVYSQAVDALGRVTTQPDALSQNAQLHAGLAYVQLADKNKARMAFGQAATSDADRTLKELAAYNYALCLHETSYSAFGESVTAFESFLNEFPSSPYAEQVNNYLVEVYMNTRSYDAALKSIERIARPGTRILEAKQKILFQLGTQALANAAFEQATGYFTQSVGLAQYNRQTGAEACYWRGEAYYRLGRMTEAERDFRTYLQQTAQTDDETYALAHYNLAYIAFHRKDYTQAADLFLHYTRQEKGIHPDALADAYNRLGDCHLQVRDFEEAKHYYALAEQTSATAGDYAFYQLALVSGLQKDYAGKVTLLNRLTGKYPSSAYVVNALYEKGRAYVLMDNADQAIRSFRELLSTYPQSPLGRKAAAEIGWLYYQKEDYRQAIAAYRLVVEKYPGSDEARMAMRDLKSIYVDQNRVEEFAALAASLPGHVRFDANEQDSLTYAAAEKIYMKGRTEEAKNSFARYLQSFPEGAFALNAHYYLCLIGSEQKQYDAVLEHSAKLLDFPDNPFVEEVLVWRAEVQFNLQQTAEALASYRLLKEKAGNAERRLLAETGLMRCAFLLHDDVEMIHAATALLAEAKLTPELRNEALYYRAKAYTAQQAGTKALADYRQLAADTRNVYGAEAKYRVAQYLYDAREYAAAEKELLDYIEQSTPHVYWLARGFVLLSDVYHAQGKDVDARQYLLSLQQNYQADDDIRDMIESRLKQLNEKN